MNIKWNAVFFDFDGVVLDSVNIKTDAFAQMFSPYGKKIEKKVIEYHLANGGVSRYDKFYYFYNKLLKKPIDDSLITKLDEKFSSIVFKRVLEAKFIDGALDAIKKLYDSGIKLFVVSGTPNKEINEIVKLRNLSKYFKEVHGSPRKKDVIIKDIQLRYQLELEKCLFVGDAMTDYEAAKSTGTEFIGIVENKNCSPFPDGTKISLKKVCIT